MDMDDFIGALAQARVVQRILRSLITEAVAKAFPEQK